MYRKLEVEIDHDREEVVITLRLDIDDLLNRAEVPQNIRNTDFGACEEFVRRVGQNMADTIDGDLDNRDDIDGAIDDALQFDTGLIGQAWQAR